jgi:HlyD family secretion protein
MDRRVILVLALAAIAASGWWWWRARGPVQIEWQGYAEADFVKIGPTLAGLLTSVFVERGVKVDRGAQLFDQDDIADRAALDQAARQLRQTEAQLANLQSAGKPTEIQQAEANLADAQAARDKLWADLQRTERLLKSGTASVQLAEQQRADLRSAAAKIQGLEAALAQLRNPLGRESEIKAQQAAVEAAHAAVAMALRPAPCRGACGRCCRGRACSPRRNHARRRAGGIFIAARKHLRAVFRSRANATC